MFLFMTTVFEIGHTVGKMLVSEGFWVTFGKSSHGPLKTLIYMNGVIMYPRPIGIDLGLYLQFCFYWRYLEPKFAQCSLLFFILVLSCSFWKTHKAHPPLGIPVLCPNVLFWHQDKWNCLFPWKTSQKPPLCHYYGYNRDPRGINFLQSSTVLVFCM